MWGLIAVVSAIGAIYVAIKKYLFKRISNAYGSMWRVVNDQDSPTNTYICSKKHIFSTEELENVYWYMDEKVTQFRALCPECGEIDIPPG